MDFLAGIYGRGGLHRRILGVGIVIFALVWLWGGFGFTWYSTRWLSVVYHDALAQPSVYDHRLTYAFVVSTYAAISSIFLAMALFVLSLKIRSGLDVERRLDALEALTKAKAKVQVLTIGNDALIADRFADWISRRDHSISALGHPLAPREHLLPNSGSKSQIQDDVQRKASAIIARMISPGGCKELHVAFEADMTDEGIVEAVLFVIQGRPEIPDYCFYMAGPRGEFTKTTQFRAGKSVAPEEFPEASPDAAAA